MIFVDTKGWKRSFRVSPPRVVTSRGPFVCLHTQVFPRRNNSSTIFAKYYLCTYLQKYKINSIYIYIYLYSIYTYTYEFVASLFPKTIGVLDQILISRSIFGLGVSPFHEMVGWLVGSIGILIVADVGGNPYKAGVSKAFSSPQKTNPTYTTLTFLKKLLVFCRSHQKRTPTQTSCTFIFGKSLKITIYLHQVWFPFNW